MSLGTGQATRGMQAALGYAVSHGVLVVASAGNSGRPGPGLHAVLLPGRVHRGDLGGGGERRRGSGRRSPTATRRWSCPRLASSIIGAGPGGSYLQASGTSPASAFVAGVAALIRSAYPRLSPAQVAQALISSARRRPAGGYSPSTGFGEVDAVAAVRAAGRLAAARPAAGLAARGHFGAAAPGPIQVTHRNAARIAVLAGVAAAGAAGVIIALVVLTLLTVRTVRTGGGWPRRARPGPPAIGAAPAPAHAQRGPDRAAGAAGPAGAGLGDPAEPAGGRDRGRPGRQPDPEPGTETGP